MDGMVRRVSRETLLDVTINAIPVVILAFFIVLLLGRSPWRGPLLVDVLTYGLLVVPLLLLVIATYLTARAIERDAGIA